MKHCVTVLKQVKEWLNANGWWVFSVGILVNFLVLILALTVGGDDSPGSLSISLMILEIFLIVVALSGFWMLRNVVKERAEEVAKEVAESAARETARETAEPAAMRAAEEYLEAFRQSEKGSGDPQAVANALDDDDSGGA